VPLERAKQWMDLVSAFWTIVLGAENSETPLPFTHVSDISVLQVRHFDWKGALDVPGVEASTDDFIDAADRVLRLSKGFWGFPATESREEDWDVFQRVQEVMCMPCFVSTISSLALPPIARFPYEATVLSLRYTLPFLSEPAL